MFFHVYIHEHHHNMLFNVLFHAAYITSKCQILSSAPQMQHFSWLTPQPKAKCLYGTWLWRKLPDKSASEKRLISGKSAGRSAKLMPKKKLRRSINSHWPIWTQLVPKKVLYPAVWRYFVFQPDHDSVRGVVKCFSPIAAPQIFTITLNSITKYSMMKLDKSRNKDRRQ